VLELGASVYVDEKMSVPELNFTDVPSATVPRPWSTKLNWPLGGVAKATLMERAVVMTMAVISAGNLRIGCPSP
jgi:hypothetical protein